MINNCKIIISGIEGQGVLLLSKILAYAGFISEKESTLLPVYTPRIRDSFIIAQLTFCDTKVKSPVIDKADILVALHKRSIDLEHRLKEGGTLIYNHSVINDDSEQDKDITYIPVDASFIAHSLGNPALSNMVMLGGLCETVNLEDKYILKSIKENLPELSSTQISSNIQAFHKGRDYRLYNIN